MTKRKKATGEIKSDVRTPIRFQISAPEGGEVERALEEILLGIPKSLRASVNVGSLFRQVMLKNDTAIAKMIRTTVQDK